MEVLLELAIRNTASLSGTTKISLTAVVVDKLQILKNIFVLEKNKLEGLL